MVILLDQFSRNCFRNSPEPFVKYDPKARELVHYALEKGYHKDESLHPIQRAFFFLPLEHHEDAKSQQLTVDLFEGLLEEVKEKYEVFADQVASYLTFAHKHEVVIDKFGRFPHRNAVLGRETTPEEQAHLDAHNGFL